MLDRFDVATCLAGNATFRRRSDACTNEPDDQWDVMMDYTCVLGTSKICLDPSGMNARMYASKLAKNLYGG